METDLYLPVKRHLESLGLAVKGEVKGCDLVGLSDGEPELVVIGELKRAFTLELVLQAVDRTAAAVMPARKIRFTPMLMQSSTAQLPLSAICSSRRTARSS